MEATIVRLKREYPAWGAPKIREKLRRQFTGPHLPAISTVHAVLDRHHLVKRRKRRRSTRAGTELSRPTAPNALWCADYKGEFLLGNRRYCYPLTITDFASRYLLTCEALLTTPGDLCLHGLRAHLQGVWPAGGDPDRQRRAVRLARMRSMGSASSRSGGCGWGLRWNALHRASRNKTAGTNGCT